MNQIDILNKTIYQMQELSRLPDFNLARKQMHEKIITSFNPKQASSDELTRFIKNEDVSKFALKDGVEMFRELIFFDLTGFGPASFFLSAKGWLRITCVGKKTIVQIRHQDPSEIQMGCYFENNMMGLQRLAADLGRRLDDEFPVFTGSLNDIYFEAVQRPVAKEQWFRMTDKKEAALEWPNMNL